MSSIAMMIMKTLVRIVMVMIEIIIFVKIRQE